MKLTILILLLLGTALYLGGWAVDRYGSPDSRVNMDSLPLYMLGIALWAIDAVLFIGYALWRLFFA